jgi:hypothetical protein
VELAQTWIAVHREPAAFHGDDFGRLDRALEVARVHRDDVLVSKLRGESARLLAAALVQRGVRLSLPAALAVPVRLAVTGKEQCRHRV